MHHTDCKWEDLIMLFAIHWQYKSDTQWGTIFVVQLFHYYNLRSVLTHFGIVNRNQWMLARFNKESKIWHQWNIVVTVQTDLTLKSENIQVNSNLTILTSCLLTPSTFTILQTSVLSMFSTFKTIAFEYSLLFICMPEFQLFAAFRLLYSDFIIYYVNHIKVHKNNTQRAQKREREKKNKQTYKNTSHGAYIYSS